MKISRENYETWFVNWLDNNLPAGEIDELNLFLERNPDLRDEFTDFCVLNLKPIPARIFGKEKLKKSIADIPATQFEILCAAAAENDLDEAQLEELDEMISNDPFKTETFHIISKIRLSPPALHYKNKRILFRSTPSRKILRIAWIGLSAAAAVAIMLMTGVLKQQSPADTGMVIAHSNPVQLPSDENGSGPVAAEEIVPEQESSAVPVERTPEPVQTAANTKQTEDLSKTREAVTVPEKIVFTGTPEISGAPSAPVIIPYTASYIPPEVSGPDDERSNVGRFLARHFRSKILNEDIPSEAPLKGYEIAEAGIDGLNKLLGWDMALTENTDENGRVRSLNFSSRMLKFNAPVKNNLAAE